MKARVVAISAAIGLVVATAAPLPRRTTSDWPMFGRDGTRNAVSPEKDPPLYWQVEDGKHTNIKWEAQLGDGANCSTPVVSGGLVWVGTNNSKPRDPRIKDDAAVLMCFRATDGKFLWQYVSPRLPGNTEDFARGCLNCAPLVEGDRLYFTTNRAEVVCLDIGPLRHGTGEPRHLWTLDMRDKFGVFPTVSMCGATGFFRCSVSASYRGRLYITTGNGVGEDRKTVPFPRAPSLLCLDRDTGAVHWSDNSPGKDILHSQWSSPLVVEVRGKAQVIATQGDGWVRSFDAMTGTLLWKFDTNPKAAVWKLGGRGTRNHVPATPVFHDGLVYIGNGDEEEAGCGVGHLWCIDPARTPTNKDRDLSPVGDNFDPRAEVNKASGLVWHYGGPLARKENDREFVFARSMSSVAIHDGLVIAPDIAGYIHCLDARTGEPRWVYDAKDQIIGSPLIADGKVYVPTTDGRTVVLALAREMKLLAENEVPEAIRASPVFADGVLFLASSERLYAIKGGKR